jgi:protein-S-isoprenylcysteine O-methyltransferase Ste14
MSLQDASWCRRGKLDFTLIHLKTEFICRGGLWVLAQNLLTLAVVLLGPIFSGQWQNGASLAGGLLLLLAGAVFGVAGVKALGRNLTPYPKPRRQTQLVQHGIYALVRHPLYSSLTFLSLGWALVWRSWPALAAGLVLVILLDAKARREEGWLREKFPQYAGYASRVRRLIPWLY